jgi:hypothetical protein
MPNLYKVQDHGRDLLGHFMASHDAMVGEYILPNAHNYNLMLKFAIYFCPSYFASMALRVSATRQVI